MFSLHQHYCSMNSVYTTSARSTTTYVLFLAQQRKVSTISAIQAPCHSSTKIWVNLKKLKKCLSYGDELPKGVKIAKKRVIDKATMYLPQIKSYCRQDPNTTYDLVMGCRVVATGFSTVAPSPSAKFTSYTRWQATLHRRWLLSFWWMGVKTCRIPQLPENRCMWT